MAQVVVHRGILGQLADREIGKTDDGTEDVVEVVGNAAGQGADCFHLPGLVELGLQGDLVTDVTFDRDKMGDRAGRVADR